MLKVCIAGVTGWVGKPLSIAISKTEDIKVVAGVCRSHKGYNLKDLTAEPSLDLTISASVTEALHTPVDILVDYTKATVVKAHVMEAIHRKVNVVIGSSGLTDQDFIEIEQAALDKGVGVIAAGNFAITAVLLQRFACEAAKYLSQWEIIDYASDRKEDAPSGTARELAFRLSQVKAPDLTHPIDKTVGFRESRGATLSSTQVHSIRLPGYVLGVEAIFGGADERLIIRHDAGNGATPYIAGTLLAIRKVKNYVGLVRGLDKILD